MKKTVSRRAPSPSTAERRPPDAALILMQIMSSAFTMLSLSPYTKKLIWGSVLILVLGLNHLIGNINAKTKRK